LQEWHPPCAEYIVLNLGQLVNELKTKQGTMTNTRKDWNVIKVRNNNSQNGFTTTIKIFFPILLLKLTRKNTKILKLHNLIGFAH
jgi:hypothetical protein